MRGNKKFREITQLCSMQSYARYCKWSPRDRPESI